MPGKARRALRFIDLFAGIGGLRCGFTQAAEKLGLASQCVFTSEVKPHAVRVLGQNYPGDEVAGDITQIPSEAIPDFDVLLGGFPCQAFSAAGKRMGFADTRGTLFFEVERIVRDKQPLGFLLENVEGLVKHDRGRTLQTIVGNLRLLGYHVDYRVLNACEFGLAQDRNRIYIVGTRQRNVPLDGHRATNATLSGVLEQGLPTHHSPTIDRLLALGPVEKLHGLSLKDKRGGAGNVHSWDIGLKGEVTPRQRALLNALLLQRRKRKWAEEIGIEWMDGMPLTEGQIATFFEDTQLHEMLGDLVAKRYLSYEHPKQRVEVTGPTGRTGYARVPDPTKPKGYNIVAGKLSYEVNKILDPNGIAPTLVATDMQRLYVPDGQGLRRLTLREGLRLFGYPECYRLEVTEQAGFDLLGNTVAVPVVEWVAGRLIEAMNIAAHPDGKNTTCRPSSHYGKSIEIPRWEEIKVLYTGED